MKIKRKTVLATAAVAGAAAALKLAANAKGNKEGQVPGKGIFRRANGPRPGCEDVPVENSTIYSKHIRVPGNPSGADANMLVIGGPGRGKTRSVVLPNLLQEDVSYVVTSGSDDLFMATEPFLSERGYRVLVFDPANPDTSDRYNPLWYIKTTDDIHALIDCITAESLDSSFNEYGHREEYRSVILAAIWYLIECRPEQEQTLWEASQMFRAGMESFCKIFEEARAENPDAECARYYGMFRTLKPAVQQELLTEAKFIFSPHQRESLKALTGSDDMDLCGIGEQLTALHIMIPRIDYAGAALARMLCSQALTAQIREHTGAGNCRDGYHVKFVLDEFPNLGRLPGFQEQLSCIGKCGASCILSVQTARQLKHLYAGGWEAVPESCGAVLYLGNCDLTSWKLVASLCPSGKRGRQTVSDQDIRSLPQGKVICCIPGMEPAVDDLFETEEHPNYIYVSEAATRADLSDAMDLDGEGPEEEEE